MLLLSILTAVCQPALAQKAPGQYPEKPIHFISATPPGGASGIATTLLAEKLRETLGQPVVVEYRGGAAGIVGTTAVAKAAPDGYTLLMGYTGSLTINPHLHKKLQYQTFEDFDPVSLVMASPFLLVIHPSIKANNVSELIAIAKSSRNPLNYASAGNGSLHHLGMEWLKLRSGVNLTHIPYQGAQMFIAAIAGDVQLSFTSVVGMLPNVKAGKVKPIAITSKIRSPLLPDVPTMIESGFPGFELTNWFGVVVPRKTPKPIIDRLSSITQAYMKTAEVKKRLATAGANAVGSTPEEFAKIIKDEYNRWGPVVKASGATVD